MYGGLHQRGDLGPQGLDLVLEHLAHLVHVHAHIVAVQKVRRLGQLRLGVVHAGEQHPVLHIALGGHDDDQHPFFRQAQKLDMPENRAAPRCHHHAHKLRQAGQQVGRVGEHFLRLVGGQRLLAKALRLHRQHGVHKQAVAPRRGNASGRGVGADDQAQLLQIGHDVADGGGRQLQAGRLGQGAAAHRLPVSDVALDERLEQHLGAVVKHEIILVM